MPLAKAFARFQATTAQVAEAGMKDPNEAGAASSDYLRMFALVAMAYVWARMAKVASERLAAAEKGGDSEVDRAFLENKLKTAQYFMDRVLPDTSALGQKIQAGAGSMMALDEAAF